MIDHDGEDSHGLQVKLFQDEQTVTQQEYVTCIGIHGSYVTHIKGTGESTLGNVSSVPMMHLNISGIERL